LGAKEKLECLLEGTSSLTRRGQSVLILGGMVRDSLQHHPHGEGEHGCEEAIEDEVEEEDKGYRGKNRVHRF
jgi:hypothetical protein